MACQFGRRTIRAEGVSRAGDRLVCLTPPLGSPSGGFVAVGIAVGITFTRSKVKHGGGGGGRPVVSPRGAQSFEYAPLWLARAVRPSEVDLGGGTVVSVLGAHLHTAGACRFNPVPVEHTDVHVVSSAVVRCEVSQRDPGDGALTLVAETPAAVAAAAAAAAAAVAAAAAKSPEGGAGGTAAVEIAGVLTDNGCVGLALLARRPAVVTSVAAARSMASTAITIFGANFVASSLADGASNAGGTSGGGGNSGGGGGSGGGDEQASVAPPPHNAAVGPGRCCTPRHSHRIPFISITMDFSCVSRAPNMCQPLRRGVPRWIHVGRRRRRQPPPRRVRRALASPRRATRPYHLPGHPRPRDRRPPDRPA